MHSNSILEWALLGFSIVLFLPWYSFHISKNITAGKIAGRFSELKRQLKEVSDGNEEVK